MYRNVTTREIYDDEILKPRQMKRLIMASMRERERNLRCKFNFKPSSTPESGISGFSARHERNFPWSSIFGMYDSVEPVAFPSFSSYAERNEMIKKEREWDWYLLVNMPAWENTCVIALSLSLTLRIEYFCECHWNVYFCMMHLVYLSFSDDDSIVGICYAWIRAILSWNERVPKEPFKLGNLI